MFWIYFKASEKKNRIGSIVMIHFPVINVLQAVELHQKSVFINKTRNVLKKSFSYIFLNGSNLQWLVHSDFKAMLFYRLKILTM
jgi:hypothetical protein